MARLDGYATAAEANLVKGVLEAEGIVAELRTAAPMELASVAGAELWVLANEIERARELLTRLAAEDARDTREAAARSERSVRWQPILIALFALGALTGWGRFWVVTRGDRVGRTVNVWNLSGTEVTELYTVTRKTLGRLVDANANGTFERFDGYDSEEHLVSRGIDADEDGRVERTEEYDRRGVLRLVYFDDDQDGRVDRTIGYRVDGVEVTTSDEDKDGLFDTRVGRRDGRVIFRQVDGPGGFAAVP